MKRVSFFFFLRQRDPGKSSFSSQPSDTHRHSALVKFDLRRSCFEKSLPLMVASPNCWAEPMPNSAFVSF